MAFVNVPCASARQPTRTSATCKHSSGQISRRALLPLFLAIPLPALSSIPIATPNAGDITTTLANGIQYYDFITSSTGTPILPESTVTIEYTLGTTGARNGWRIATGRLRFTVGAHTVIPGLEQGLIGMGIGSKRRLLIPSKLGYQREGKVLQPVPEEFAQYQRFKNVFLNRDRVYVPDVVMDVTVVQRTVVVWRGVANMSYQVNGDELFSDDEYEAVPTPSPKRPRIPTVTTPAPTFSQHAPRLGPISLSTFGNGAKLSAPSTSRHIEKPKPRGLLSGNNHYGMDSKLRPLGRGRGATLPAHITERRKLESNNEEYITKTSGSTAQLERIKQAASILPSHIREKVVQQQLEKEQMEMKQRKKPSRRIRRDRIQQNEQPSKVVMKNLQRSNQVQNNNFGLQQLLSQAQGSKGLIQLNPERNKIHKTKKFTPEIEVYKKVSMTKEMRLREEREKQQMQERKEKEKIEEEMHYRQLRDEERAYRKRLVDEWRRKPTVASDMRQSYRLAREERRLFVGVEDEMKDGLEWLGLKRKQIVEEDKVTEMMHIEIEEI